MRRIILTLTLTLLSTQTALANYVATFSDTGLTLSGPGAGMPPGSGPYNNNSGGFTSGGQYFNNVYNPTYGSWTGFSVSAATNTTTAGYTNQYSAITGSGNGTADYGVVYGSAYVNLTGNVQSIDLTNTTYAYLSMLNGDSFNKAFTTGNYFDVVITGYSGINDTGNTTGAVTFALGDYTSMPHMLLNTWTTVNLTTLGSAQSLGFSFLSNDTNSFGITVPEYVAVDNLVVAPSFVPEPSSWLLCAIGLGVGAIVGRRRLARSAHI